MIGMNTLGRSRLRRMLVRGSKTEYEMKKMVRVLLYCVLVMWRSSCRPSILAFPMLAAAN